MRILIWQVIAFVVLDILTITSALIFEDILASKSLVWKGCVPGFSCAVLDVPLDYSLPSGHRSSVPLIKISATTAPYKGIIFVNPGGPGVSAVDFLILNGARLTKIIGTNYDIVAIEPRGIGHSMPNADCSTSILQRQLQKRTVPYGPRLPTRFYEEELAYQKASSQSCAAEIGGQHQAGPHMSTLTVVKDVITLLDAYAASVYSKGVQYPKDFNYWGLSYGTIIGQTFAQLYPTRVGRFVLDGVLDAEDYYAGLGLKNLQQADKAFSTFFEYCSKAGPPIPENSSPCYFWEPTARGVFDRFEVLVLKLDAKQAFQQNWSNGTAIYEALKLVKLFGSQAIFQPLDVNFGFFGFAIMLATLESIVNDLTLEALIVTQLGPLSLHHPGDNSQWVPAVGCPDTGNKALGETLQQTQAISSRLEKQSWISGELFASIRLAYTKWSVKAKSTYSGKFGGSTKTPILFVSNTIDPRTPTVNGVKASSMYQKSKLLTIDAVGHTSFYVENKCGFAEIGAYFQTGQPATFSCPQEPGPFGVTLPGTLTKREQQGLEARLAALLG